VNLEGREEGVRRRVKSLNYSAMWALCCCSFLQILRLHTFPTYLYTCRFKYCTGNSKKILIIRQISFHIFNARLSRVIVLCSFSRLPRACFPFIYNYALIITIILQNKTATLTYNPYFTKPINIHSSVQISLSLG
jgi:hypothetical protein